MRLIILVLAMSLVVAAKDKHPASEYTEGTVLSFKMVDGGMNCKSNSSLAPVGSNVSVNTQGNCYTTSEAEYAVKVGDQTYTLSPDHTREFRAKNSVLYLQPAGAKIMVRIDKKKERVYGVVGERESKYYVTAIGQ